MLIESGSVDDLLVLQVAVRLYGVYSAFDTLPLYYIMNSLYNYVYIHTDSHI